MTAQSITDVQYMIVRAGPSSLSCIYIFVLSGEAVIRTRWCMHKLSRILSMVDGVADAVRATRGTFGIWAVILSSSFVSRSEFLSPVKYAVSLINNYNC